MGVSAPKMKAVCVPCDNGPAAGGGVPDDITGLRDLAAEAKVALREAARFLTKLTSDNAPAEPLRRLRDTLEAIAALSRHMIDGLKDDAWGDLQLPRLLVHEMTGFDQHLLTPEQREALWKTAGERHAALVEKHRRQHPDEEPCEICEGIGFLHSDDAFGLRIWPCDECEKYDYDEAVLAHRELCGCNYPEYDGEGWDDRGIRFEKGNEFDGIRCPRCGQGRKFFFETNQKVFVFDRKPVELGAVEFDANTRAQCTECKHSGALSEFCPNQPWLVPTAER
jgi:hypothetical protein